MVKDLIRIRAQIRIILSCTYIDNLLDNSLVAGHLGALQHAHLGSDPGEEEEFPPLGHLVAHLDANVAKTTLGVGKVSLELVKVLASGSAHNTRAIELHHDPVEEMGEQESLLEKIN